MMLFEELSIDSRYGREAMTPSQKGLRARTLMIIPGKTKRYLGLALYLVLCPDDF